MTASQVPADPRLRGHIPALDGVRGLAILMVTLYRFRGLPGEVSAVGPTDLPLLNFGARGVDLFFVLSGFLITGILHDSKAQPHFFRDFYMRRTLRIFPLYYGTLVVAFVLLPAISSPGVEIAAEPHQAWLWLYGANLLISFQGEWVLGAFDHFWSLAVEEQFYLVWPLVVYFCSAAVSRRIAASLVVAAAASRVAWVLLGGNGAAAEVFTLFRLDSLLLGAWLALVARQPQGLQKLTPLAKRTLGTTGAMFAIVALLDQRLLTLPTTLCALFFGAVLILAVTAPEGSPMGRVWSNRSLRLLGKYSYGMYVLQNPLIPLLAPFFTAGGLATAFGSALLGRLAYMGVMSAATLLAAIVIYHAWEQHFLRLKTHFDGGRQRPGKREPDARRRARVQPMSPSSDLP
ncbi:MAG: acyltransferase [Planctomycetes bacterium]|nr:acyltransferase [Planctomycetota bacterium]